MENKPIINQSSSVNFYGSVGNINAPVAGHDINIGHYQNAMPNSNNELSELFKSLHEKIHAAAPENKQEVSSTLSQLEETVNIIPKAEDKTTHDGKMASLVEKLIGLAPSAASAIGSTFAAPILKGLVGPTTQWVLSKITG